MTNHDPLDFIRSLRTIVLPDATKARMRADLSAYADLHTAMQPLVRPSSRGFSALWVRTRGLYAGALALVLVIAGGTQASFASEKAVPGDILYSMKVAVAEPIALAFTASTEGRAELAARYASRRVDEAAALSSEGRLDDRTADELAVRFDSHVDTLAKETSTLEAKGDLAVSLAVRSDLEQKLAVKVDEIAPPVASAPVAVMMAKVAQDTQAAVAPESRFAARVAEKSRSLATTRERLDAALALDTKAQVSGAPVSLAAVLHTDEPELSDAAPSSVLFLAKQPDAAVMMSIAATTTATTTSTTTAEAAPQSAVEGSAPTRFFAPFRAR